MASHSPRPSPRGSALLTTVILLAVLTVVGVAAVSLSSQERTNAASQAKVAFAEACANAAQAKIWAEMSQYGLAYLGSTVQVTARSLPDGTRFMAPAHYGGLTATTQVKDVTFKAETGGTTGDMSERDCTNGACGIVPLGQTYGMTALCVDPAGREYEIELAVRFAI